MQFMIQSSGGSRPRLTAADFYSFFASWGMKVQVVHIFTEGNEAYIRWFSCEVFLQYVIDYFLKVCLTDVGCDFNCISLIALFCNPFLVRYISSLFLWWQMSWTEVQKGRRRKRKDVCFALIMCFEFGFNQLPLADEWHSQSATVSFLREQPLAASSNWQHLTCSGSPFHSPGAPS